MNQHELQAAIGSATLIAWRPSDGGLARVRVVETGIVNPTSPRTVLQRDSSRIQIVQATFEFSPDVAGWLVSNRELEEWTQDTEHTFSVLNDREAFRSDTLQAAALAGIPVARVDATAQLVMLSGIEFQRVCQLLAPITPRSALQPDDIIDEEATQEKLHQRSAG
jgi:hypothetical protein